MFISENYCPISSPNSDRPGIDNPLAMLRDHDGNGVIEADEVFIFTKDHLNSVREITDHSQKLIQRYNYSAYGKTKVERVNSGADHRFVENYFTHAAREWEPEIGIICNRNRCHDINGRWLNEDPKMFNGKDNNLYNMVKNNPIRYTDPFGFSFWEDAKDAADKIEDFSDVLKVIREYFNCKIDSANCGKDPAEEPPIPDDPDEIPQNSCPAK